MKLLGMDTTGESMSVAVTDGARLLVEIFADIGKKHSQTLMAAVDQALALAGMAVSDMDAFAVAVGPGSFTGIRIGTAAASAFAYAEGKPVYAVSTLDSLLENAGNARTACAVMDARRGEVYAAARSEGEPVIRESALPLTQLLGELLLYEGVAFVGDAALRYRDVILEKKPDSRIWSEQFALQRASSVCMCAHRGIAQKTTHDQLKPHYLRESQAQRMKRDRENG